MTSNEPTIESRQAVVDGAERGAQLAGGDNRYIDLIKVALQAVGLELARHLQPGESPSLCVPANVAHDGRSDPGMVMLLDQRLVIAWIEGTFRVKRRSLAFALSDISEVATSARDHGRLSPYRDAIIFTADGARHEFALPSRLAADRLTFMVHGVLSGTATFSQDPAG